jgi:hypothetical protein
LRGISGRRKKYNVPGEVGRLKVPARVEAISLDTGTQRSGQTAIRQQLESSRTVPDRTRTRDGPDGSLSPATNPAKIDRYKHRRVNFLEIDAGIV